jgi:outer membrane protein assembly factor BamD (BamD/ComL family)
MRFVVEIMLAAAATLSLASGSWADEEEDYCQAEEKTKTAIADGKWKPAIDAWKAYRAKYSDAPGAVKATIYLAAGYFHEEAGADSFAEAEVGLKSEQLSPADRRQLLSWAGRARLGQAHARAKDGQAGEATEQAQAAQNHFEALRKDFAGTPEASEAIVHLAVALDLLGRPADAVRELTAWLDKHNPKDQPHPLAADARYLLGRNLVRAGRFDDGISALSTYLQEHPRGSHAPDACFMRATARIHQ